MSIDLSSETIEDGRVPIVRQPVPALRHIEELPSVLSDVIESNVPAFLIKAATLSKVGMEDSEVFSKFLLTKLFESGHYFLRSVVFPDVASTSGRTRVGTGKLHIDKIPKEFPDQVSEIDDHVTTSGKGRAYFANAGSDLANIDRAGVNEASLVLDDMLLRGFVNPAYIQLTIYGTPVHQGDHIIFAQLNKFGPVWHRFDTVTGPRKAEVVVMERTSEARAKMAMSRV